MPFNVCVVLLAVGPAEDVDSKDSRMKDLFISRTKL